MPENLNALVIDDEEDVRTLLSRYLNLYDCQSDLVVTCEEGIKKFQDSPTLYDVVITDLNQMPSGVDVVKAVRESSNPNIPVYIMTGGTDVPGLAKEAKNLVGPERYIQKPFDFDELCKRIVEDAKKTKV